MCDLKAGVSTVALVKLPGLTGGNWIHTKKTDLKKKQSSLVSYYCLKKKKRWQVLTSVLGHSPRPGSLESRHTGPLGRSGGGQPRVLCAVPS